MTERHKSKSPDVRLLNLEVQVNIGTGEEVSIRELAETGARVVGFTGDLAFDASKPDGAPRKLLDVSLMESLGWKSRTSLEDGLKTTNEWYLHSRSGGLE
jgi:GDP-L-fucose synthase